MTAVVITLYLLTGIAVLAGLVWLKWFDADPDEYFMVGVVGVVIAVIWPVAVVGTGVYFLGKILTEWSDR
jgi:hypothetical protein